ncbi:YSIRK-type signal peptide-containing protein [Staphylococcus condimenti]|uniref:YSIRK-type signal peptide-containing protein n=1 Tax=Staphylococcus condimenti TaxID=70255 RepID=UPI00254BF48A|nr:YSIRK-type signal peptide-containing protein [Staphylococcus condimenti]MDK8645059.1 YSIRK-type signal peptide-containing protein [Staphylococcus condimenti]
MKKLDFLPNLKNKYSIRKFTVGTASILLGTLLFLGQNDAQAAEETSEKAVAEVANDSTKAQTLPQPENETTQETPPQLTKENENSTLENNINDVKSENGLELNKEITETSTPTTSTKQENKNAFVSTEKQKESNVKPNSEQQNGIDTNQQPTADTVESETNNPHVLGTESNSKLYEGIDNSAEILSTEQKVEKVKTELSDQLKSSEIDQALAVIDTDGLTSEEIKTEVVKLLLNRETAEKDLYKPQATLPRKEDESPKFAVRAVPTDKSELEKAITDGQSITNLDPNKQIDQNLIDALAEAKNVDNDLNAGQQAADDSKNKLNTAIQEKLRQDVVEELIAVAERGSKLEKAEYYTPKTAQNLKDIVDKYNTLVVSSTSNDPVERAKYSVQEIKEAVKEINDGINQLERKPDKTELEEALDKAVMFDNLDKNDPEDKAVDNALKAGQDVEGDLNATTAEVEKAAKDLNDALDAKAKQDALDAAAKDKQAALDELNKAVDTAQNIEQAEFTPESVKPLETAKEAGKQLAADNAATPEQLKAATKLIQDAINQLAPDKSELTKQIEAAKALEPLNDSATDQILKNTLDAAIAVQNDPDAKPQAIKEATWNLEDEINNKIAADAIEALRAAVNKANAADEPAYTPDSFAPLKVAAVEGQSILDDPSSASVPETIAKTKEINQFIDGLKEKADKTELEKALDTAVGLDNLDINDPEDKAVDDALKAGQEVEGDLNATPEQVKQVTDDLNNALNAKKEQDTKDAEAKAKQDALDELNKALEAANTVNKTDYTPNTVTPLDDAVKAGETAKADANKTPEELKQAAKAINDAKDALKEKADKVALDQAIKTAEALNNLEPADTEDKAVQNALDKAKEVLADPNSEQNTVDEAKNTLNDALNAKKEQDAKDAANKEKQAALDELEKALEAAKAVNKTDYTPNTVTPLDDAVKAGETAKADINKTPEELKQAAKAINDAKDALKAKADKTELEKALDTAVGFDNLDLNDPEDKAVDDALKAGQEIEGDLNATPEQVKKAAESLNKALDAKAKQDAKDDADKEKQDALNELNAELEKANAVNKENYTPNSVETLADAVQDGQAIVDAPNDKTADEIKKTTQLVKDAQNALQTKADKTKLNEAIIKAEDKGVQEALDEAKKVQADPNADQNTVDAAKDALNNVVNVKQEQDAKDAEAKQDALDELNKALETAKTVNKADYTPNTVTSLDNAVKAGETAKADINKTPLELKQAAKAINDAKDALQTKADKTELEKALDVAVAFDNLDMNDPEDKAVDDALKAGQEVEGDLNATPEQVKKAADDLNKALNLKAEQDAKEAAEKVKQENKVDKTELDKSIEKAENINYYDPGDKEDATVLDALSNAKEVEAAADALQIDVDKAKSELDKALNAKAEQDAKEAAEKAKQENKVDKTELDKSIEKAENINYYDPGDKEDAAVLDALSNAIETAADPNISQTKVNEAVAALNSAIATKNAQDVKDALEAAKVKEEELDTGKTKEEFVNEEIVQPNNEYPIVDEDRVDQTIVDKPTTKPVEEIQTTTEDSKDKLAELQKAIDKVKIIPTSEYTQQSVESLEKAVKNGELLVKNSDELTIEEIQNALQIIEDAINSLEVKETTAVPTVENDAESKLTSNVENSDSNSTVKSNVKQNQTLTKEANHKAKNNKEKVLPETGENLTPINPIYASLMIAVGGLMMFYRKRKNEDKDSTEK